MNFQRDLTETLKRFAKFPVVVLLGPRQSGKTTLVKEVFKNHTYLNFEDPETLAFAQQDPKRFLREYENGSGIIIDEFQHAPTFLSYIQIESDTKNRPGYFVLTGSQNFLMNQAITQSLAGRAGILHLLPLSIHELIENKLLSERGIDATILSGGYPRIYAQSFLPEELFPSYIRTYVERDVRQLINVENIATFQKFMKLCAGRVGQLLNIEDLAVNCGINRKTAQQWLSILEKTYIIFLLQPHVNNFNKRVTKTPKLYFYDTGLACSFLGLKSKNISSTSILQSSLSASPDTPCASCLSRHSFSDGGSLSKDRGHLFENLIIADLYKQYYNRGLEAPLYFWRDQNGRIEVDCIIDSGGQLTPIEIKSAETVVSDFFKSLEHWCEFAEVDPAKAYLIYAGELMQRRSQGQLMSWKKAAELIGKIEKR